MYRFVLIKMVEDGSVQLLAETIKCCKVSIQGTLSRWLGQS